MREEVGGFLEGPCRGRKLVKEEDLSADEYSCGGGGHAQGGSAITKCLRRLPPRPWPECTKT